MSFNAKTSLDQFYNEMGKPAPTFKLHVEQKFLPDLKKPFIKGGANRSARKLVIQEAVDALGCYGAIDASDAATKRRDFETAYRLTFNEGLPPNSRGMGVQAVKMNLIKDKLNVLTKKLGLLAHWEQANLGGLLPDNMAEDEKEFEKQMFLFNLYQSHPTKVKPILQILLNDAREVLDAQMFRLTTESGVYADANYVFQSSSDAISSIVKLEATARAGFQGEATFELAYKGLKGEMSAEVFAGIRAKLEAEGKIIPGQVSVSGNVHVDIGLVVEGHARFDIGDMFEVDASVTGLAGAQLDVGGKIVASYEGVEFELHADAFAGVRIHGEASGTLKLGGRNITTVKVEGSAWAGAGASAAIGFKCSVFGEISFKLKAGAAVGVGASGGLALTLDPMAIQYGTLNLVWIYASEQGIKGKGRVHFLSLEENQKMSEMASKALAEMIAELQHQNAGEMEQLKRWNLIQNKVINNRHVSAWK